MSRLQQVTSFFDVARQSDSDKKVSIETCLEEYADLKKHKCCKELPREGFLNFLTQVLANNNFVLNQDQEEKILSELSENALHGEVDRSIWQGLFRYWLREDTSPVSAFLAVDVQNDFISGSLALRNCPGKQEGEEVVEVINSIKKTHPFDYFFYTLDWHPDQHCSFVTNVGKYKLHPSSQKTAEEAKILDTVVYDGEHGTEQILWPPHCIQGSHGSELHKDLHVDDKDIKIYKGTKATIDSYSAFWDNGRLSQTNLLLQLLERRVTQVFIGGLATDFCVAFTALDCAHHGFDTFVVDEACRGVSENSIAEMKGKMMEAGVRIISESQIKEYLGK